jgi:hypothetical protein
VQGTLVLEDNTVFNALYDRRALTTLTLGNALTFEDPANPGVLFRRIQDRLAGTTVAALRDQIKRTTPNITQAQVGVTKPMEQELADGAGSVQLTSTGAIPPVPEVVGFETGRPATGNIITTSAQLIGLNLYSSRDTHVFSSTSLISSPQPARHAGGHLQQLVHPGGGVAGRTVDPVLSRPQRHRQPQPALDPRFARHLQGVAALGRWSRT